MIVTPSAPLDGCAMIIEFKYSFPHFHAFLPRLVSNRVEAPVMITVPGINIWDAEPIGLKKINHSCELACFNKSHASRLICCSSKFKPPNSCRRYRANSHDFQLQFG